MASGRAACDWQTLFTAVSKIQDAELIIVCASSDAAEVRRLNTIGARVFVDIPRRQHLELLASASVYVLCLHEEEISSGHIRLMNAISVATPVVATNVRALLEYVRPGVTAHVVPAHSPQALRAGITELLDSPSLARDLAQNALTESRERTYEVYFRSLRDALRATERTLLYSASS